MSSQNFPTCKVSERVQSRSHLSRISVDWCRWSRKPKHKEGQRGPCTREPFCFFGSIYRGLHSTWEKEEMVTCSPKSRFCFVKKKKREKKMNEWNLPTRPRHPAVFPSRWSRTSSRNCCSSEDWRQAGGIGSNSQTAIKPSAAAPHWQQLNNTHETLNYTHNNYNYHDHRQEEKQRTLQKWQTDTHTNRLINNNFSWIPPLQFLLLLRFDTSWVVSLLPMRSSSRGAVSFMAAVRKRHTF